MTATVQIAVATYDFRQAVKECHEAMERVEKEQARVMDLLEFQEVWK